MGYLILCMIFATAISMYFLYDKYILPNVREQAKAEVWNIEKSKNKEVLKIQQALANINDSVETLYDHIDLMDTDVIRKMSLGEANEMAAQVQSIVRGLNKTQEKVSTRTQANALGAIPNPFKFGTKRELSPLQVYAEKASFHGQNGSENFLKAIKAVFPNINNKEQFLAMNEEARLNIVRKVKQNNLPI